MMNNSTIEALKAMRFSAMAAEFERQLGDPAAYSMLGFEERFALMVDAEWNRRQHYLKRRFRQRKDLSGLRSWKRGLPQIQVCAIYPAPGTVGGIEPGAGKRRAEETD